MGKATRSVAVMVRLTPDGADILDQLRGNYARGEYLRDLLIREHLKGNREGARRL